MFTKYFNCVFTRREISSLPPTKKIVAHLKKVKNLYQCSAFVDNTALTRMMIEL